MRVNSFIHPVTFDSAIASVDTSYHTDRKHTVTLGSFPAGSAFTGKLKQITIWVSSIASSAANMSFKVTSDSAGNKILTDVDAGAFTIGQTATTGSLTFVPEYPIYVAGGDTVYIWYKVNTGTCTVDADSHLIWEE
jgi:hypothetical protein|tara:strand:- start:660 stop:1067 length:408 start_codon:yes stop_codon:yes gene_type:complete